MNFLTEAAACGIHTSYYALCDSHPLRPALPIIPVSPKNLVETVSSEVPLEKLRGPGTVYRLLSLPEGVALNFIIQRRNIVETHFRISSAENVHEGTFAILSKEIMEHEGAPLPSPPYPRPLFYSVSEFIAIVRGFDQFVRRLGAVA